MVNDNETTSTQPELNMVTETTPTTEAPAEAPIEAPAEETSTEGTEAVADTAVSTTETSTKEPDLGTYPASTEKPVNSLEKQMEESNMIQQINN